MGTGYLSVHLTTADSALPVSGAQVRILDTDGNLLYTQTSDQSGRTPRVSLPAPDASAQFDPSLPVRPYAQYTVEVTAPGYHQNIINGVQIYDAIGSELPVSMNPNRPGDAQTQDEYNIGDNALEIPGAHQNPPSPGIPAPNSARIHNEVFIPERITVHLGTPSQSARNVTVAFTDYIKNVASSEIFPDWPYEALRANILAQISLALNRIFTEWYRSQGYSFDITNSTQYDQQYVEGRNIFDSVSQIVDEIFNNYIVNPPGIEPYYAEYCNGSTATCPGLKQWGTVSLANEGRNYLQILQYYYGADIYIASTDNIQTPYESFPGTLATGASGPGVASLQALLNRIRQNYPRIPAVTVDGRYGPQTAAAVREFQTIFGLPQTGAADRATWYKISYIYAAVMKLAELGSEGYQPPETAPPPVHPAYPGSPLAVGSYGSSVSLMQQYLDLISNAYPSIPKIAVDGAFGPATRAAVIAFQRQFGLTPDGIIGPATWQMIINVYNQINSGSTLPVYPGTLLRLGSRGSAVTTLQQNLNRLAARNPAIPRVAADGIFGPATQAAVLAFQRYYNLSADGIVGPETWNRLMKLAALIPIQGSNTRTRARTVSGSAVRGGNSRCPS